MSGSSALGASGVPSAAVHNPGIDGLRAVAVLSVMLYHLHASWLPGGFIGVDVFFVISGYVVTGSLVRHPASGLGRFLLDFYSRRFRRILPALLLCLLATVVASALFVPDAWLSDAVRDTALAAFLGLSNFTLLTGNDGYFAPRAEFNPFTHTWSLAVEEQFYLLYPLLLYAGLKARSARVLWAGKALFLLLLVLSLLWCAWTSRHNTAHAYFMLSARFWELGCGGLLFLIGNRWGPPREAIARLAKPAFLSGLALLAGSLGLVSANGFPFPGALPAVIGTLAIIWAVTQGQLGAWAPAAVLASRPMLAIGLRSYSLYLWHWPVFVIFRWTVGLDTAVGAVAATLLTFALAEFSYRAVEGPFQRGRLMAGWPSLRVVVAGLASTGVCWVLAQQIQNHQQTLSLSVVMRQAADWYPHPQQRALAVAEKRCAVDFTSRRVGSVGRVQEFVPAACQQPAAAPGRLFVIGDSHASAYRRMFHGFTEATGVPVTLLPEGGCALAALVEPEAHRKPGCDAFQRFALDHVAAHLKPGDVVFLAGLRVRRLSDERAGQSMGEAEAGSEAANRTRAFEEARAVVTQLEKLGAVVMLDAPKPVYPAPAFRCSDWFNRINPVCEPGLSVSRELMQSHRQNAMDALTGLKAAHPKLVVWDPLPALCPGAVCDAVDQGRALYFDGDHISGLANERLLPGFQLQVLKILGPY